MICKLGVKTESLIDLFIFWAEIPSGQLSLAESKIIHESYIYMTAREL